MYGKLWPEPPMRCFAIDRMLLDENTVLDLDANGNVCAITFEHASERTDVDRVTVEGIAA